MMMLSGLRQKERKEERVQNSIRVRMHHQLFQFPYSISSLTFCMLIR
jgi:hypothetical protein